MVIRRGRHFFTIFKELLTFSSIKRLYKITYSQGLWLVHNHFFYRRLTFTNFTTFWTPCDLVLLFVKPFCLYLLQFLYQYTNKITLFVNDMNKYASQMKERSNKCWCHLVCKHEEARFFFDKMKAFLAILFLIAPQNSIRSNKG